MTDAPLTADEMAILKNAGYEPMGGGVIGDRILVTFAKDGESYQATRAEWRTIIAELSKPPTEDAIVFGADAWVYCRQHMRPHPTGWCGVSVRDKVGLGVTDAKAAYAKCEEWGFELYKG